jgi:hypothetical protein
MSVLWVSGVIMFELTHPELVALINTALTHTNLTKPANQPTNKQLAWCVIWVV